MTTRGAVTFAVFIPVGPIVDPWW